MSPSSVALGVVAAAGVIVGSAVTYWQPTFPLLVYWLLLATILGIAISSLKSLAGLRRRAKWLVAVNGLIVIAGLMTTQIAARRAISSTHLRYQGVLLEGVSSFTVGVGVVDADVR